MTPTKIGGEIPFCTRQNKYSEISGFLSLRVLDDANFVMLKSSRTNRATPARLCCDPA